MWPAGARAAGPSTPATDVEDEGRSGPCCDESHRCQHCHTGLCVCTGSNEGLWVIIICRNRHDLSVFLECCKGPPEVLPVLDPDIAEVISTVFVTPLNISRTSRKH